MEYTVQYYDLVLGIVAGSLLAGVAVAYANALATMVTVPATGLVAMAAVYHGMFANAPVDGVEDLSQEPDLLE
jgi:hypothetical protein